MRCTVWIAGLALASLLAPASASAQERWRATASAGSFEARFGGSTGFAQLDTGVGVHRHHGWGGFLGLDFTQPFTQFDESTSLFFALTWTAIELRNSDPEGWVVGNTEAGAGMGIRAVIGEDAYVSAWAGYFFIGDTQATYPDSGDLLATWHLAYLRARARFGILALELAGGVGDTQQHFLIGARVQLAHPVWLGVDLNGSFAQRESNAHWGRELWITRLFVALRFE